MPRIRKALVAGAFAGMALAGLAIPAVAGPGGDNAPPPGCTKVEFTDGTATYLVPAGVVVTIKAGQDIFTFGPFPADTLVTVPTGKDISYVITCPVPSPSPSTTAPY